MAFLDNSGDIILDAVLTDVGRKRMAQGDFKIAKFSVGDDEIDYGLYNKDHPSGSAYYDLEILQTPILEAFTQKNANIEYGLATYSNQNLLYLPSISLNDKVTVGPIATKSNGVIYLCDETTVDSSTSQTTSQRLSADGNITNVLIGSTEGTNVVLIETGINSTQLVSTAQQQANLLINNGLLDNNFTVSYDQRFISNVQTAPIGTSFNNANTDGTGKLTIGGAMETKTAEDSNVTIENYVAATANGFINQIYKPATGTDNTATYSSITGPRASFTALSFLIPEIAQDKYIQFGSVGQTQGGSETYDFIDTIVYVRGSSTGITLQLPIRIIKLS
tara:strand:+ start:4060 stop:5061 length:1002 start_codon:yes stop_codon:yes gene_type:complete